jgi:hypothetical protein
MNRTFSPLTHLAVLAAVSLALDAFARAGHPQIDAAIQNLLAARAELEKGSANKSGERSAAISAIDRALAEARADVDYRDDKPHKKKAR